LRVSGIKQRDWHGDEIKLLQIGNHDRCPNVKPGTCKSGMLKLKEEPMAYQKRVRQEWE